MRNTFRTYGVNKRIRDIWLDHWGEVPKNISNRFPMQYSRTLDKNCFLYVGITPSWSEDEDNNPKYDALLLENPPDDLRLPSNSSKIQKVIELEETLSGKYESTDLHPYSNQLKRFVKEEAKLPFTYEHIDIFAVRETSQKDLVKHLVSENSS